jgi:hypothetical protein
MAHEGERGEVCLTRKYQVYVIPCLVFSQGTVPYSA